MGWKTPILVTFTFSLSILVEWGGGGSDLGQLESKGKVHLSMPLNRNFGHRQVVGFVRVFFSYFKKKIKLSFQEVRNK